MYSIYVICSAYIGVHVLMWMYNYHVLICHIILYKQAINLSVVCTLGRIQDNGKRKLPSAHE